VALAGGDRLAWDRSCQIMVDGWLRTWTVIAVPC
jgi:hypothetical protein